MLQSHMDAVENSLVLTMAVQTNSQGEATSVEMLRSPDAQMVRFVAAVLMPQKYKPALCNSSPCTMRFPFRMEFTRRR